MRHRLLWLFLFLLVFRPEFALAADYTTPIPASSNNLSGTIATTNTFQSIQIKNGARLGCFIQNQTGSDDMWVYFGPIAGAAKGNSVLLLPNQWVNCQTESNVLSDQVSITGTSGDAFAANFQ